MSDIKNSDLVAVTFPLWGPFFFWGMMALNERANQKDYIVASRTENKIIYRPINKTNDFHVLQFMADDKPRIIHGCIKVGDTISGDQHMLNQPVCHSGNVKLFLNGKDFETVYKNAKETKSAAIRDSIGMAMQKQK